MKQSLLEGSKDEGGNSSTKRQKSDCGSPVEVKQETSYEEEEREGKTIGDGIKESAGMAEPSRNNSDSVTPNESKPLLCLGCSRPLTIPVYECPNGHIACFRCNSDDDIFARFPLRCYFCHDEIGHQNRNKDIEKLVEHVKMECMNEEHGCKETFSYNQKEEHEKTCQYTICYCPGAECDFHGLAEEVYEHFRCHLDDEDDPVVGFQYNKVSHITLDITHGIGFLILREEKDGVLFSVHVDTEQNFKLISVRCTGPPLKTKFNYDILSRSSKSALRFQSSTMNNDYCEGDSSSDDCLVLPSAFFAFNKEFDEDKSPQLLQLDVWIWQHGVSPAEIRAVCIGA